MGDYDLIGPDLLCSSKWHATTQTNQDGVPTADDGQTHNHAAVLDVARSERSRKSVEDGGDSGATGGGDEIPRRPKELFSTCVVFQSVMPISCCASEGSTNSTRRGSSCFGAGSRPQPIQFFLLQG